METLKKYWWVLGVILAAGYYAYTKGWFTKNPAAVTINGEDEDSVLVVGEGGEITQVVNDTKPTQMTAPAVRLSKDDNYSGTVVDLDEKFR